MVPTELEYPLRDPHAKCHHERRQHVVKETINIRFDIAPLFLDIVDSRVGHISKCVDTEREDNNAVHTSEMKTLVHGLELLPVALVLIATALVERNVERDTSSVDDTQNDKILVQFEGEREFTTILGRREAERDDKGGHGHTERSDEVDGRLKATAFLVRFVFS